MQGITTFENNDFGKVRITDRDGTPWFIARDVAAALGYKYPTNAVADICKTVLKVRVPSIKVPVNVIQEPDVYRLVMKSSLPTALKFQDWVVEVVIPSIKRTGAFSVVKDTQPDTTPQVNLELVANNFSAAKRLATDLGFEDSEMLVKANQIVLKLSGVDVLQLAEYTPKPKIVSMNARELGQKYFDGASPYEVNKLLWERGLQMKRGTKWYPTKEGSKYVAYGPLKSKNGTIYAHHRSWDVSVVDVIKNKVA